MMKVIKLLASLLFGVVFPITLLFSIYTSISKLEKEMSSPASLEDIVSQFNTVSGKLKKGNDYALFSLMISENANQGSMKNKQVMKVAVIQIGFTVISIGMLFVVLGFNDGGAAGSLKGADISIDFKTASSGLGAIIIGAIMVVCGGVINSHYQTVGLPEYLQLSENFESVEMKIYKACKQEKNIDFSSCVEMGLKAYMESN
ncbi:hypothetical protein [Pseudoalteromonas sp. OANN1]|uniref:hypothetical protein n=1 Tax=Pseudoalteromonas sp. OANN1 TaxID=2954497 RepID=UPI002097DA64|nr:hypothetical protein [Pseudoalteromonas sp. OANN1]MCO7198659.1 hypothetical protein [Pseudoalteromonas sp. OANN1]